MPDEKEFKIYTMDFETDPFKHGELPQPFAVGLYDGEKYIDHWGDNAVAWIVARLKELPKGSIVYAHNGGKFDFMYFKEELDYGKLLLINGRISKAYIGHAELRDSYSILPVPLASFKKLDMDYEKLHKSRRHLHRDEIRNYLRFDCVALHEFVSEFIAEFGLKLTMASAAMTQLTRFHKYQSLSREQDETFRQFYYGGRVQCFEVGNITGDFKVYDVNSMYPSVMRNFKHPVSNTYRVAKGNLNNSIEDVDFAVVTGVNRNCLPCKTERGELIFNHGHGIFFATGHEIRAGIETGTFDLDSVKLGYYFSSKIDFSDFVDHFWNKRIDARKHYRRAHDIFYKLVLNSAYGKFAQNPENFREYVMTDKILSHPWMLEAEYSNGAMIFSRPAELRDDAYKFNVATAASITGAARAQLLRGIASAERPIYCDTDSIICEHLTADLGPELGAWKLEATGDSAAIAGKKMYAIFNKGEPIKYASKGVRISPREISIVAEGGCVEHKSDPPTFSLVRDTVFLTRKIRRTA